MSTEQTTELNEKQIAVANALIAEIQHKPFNIGGHEDTYRPIIKHLRGLGHTVVVGNSFEQNDGRKARFVSNGPERSRFATNEF